MKKSLPIKCKCNSEIRFSDITQIVVCLRQRGPNLILLKFICPHCHCQGEALIEQRMENDNLVEGFNQELKIEEMDKFREMGKIETDEVIDFHNFLKNF